MKSAQRSVVLVLLPIVASLYACAAAPSARTSNRGTVSGDDLRNANEPIEVTLQRKVPGLLVTRTSDGGIALQVRGGTFNGASLPPLYLLNGTPFHPGPEGQLTGIDPQSIETVKVFKGAEAAIYGIDGANGVIAITLKSGRKRL